MDAQDELLTPAEVAAIFRVGSKTVSRWAREGKLPSVATLGGHRRFRRRDVERVMGETRSGASAATI